LLSAPGWDIYEKTLMEQLNQRAEAVLLNVGLTEKERDFLRGELSYGMYAASLPREMVEVAKAELLFMYAQEEKEIDDGNES